MSSRGSCCRNEKGYNAGTHGLSCQTMAWLALDVPAHSGVLLVEREWTGADDTGSDDKKSELSQPSFDALRQPERLQEYYRYLKKRLAFYYPCCDKITSACRS